MEDFDGGGRRRELRVEIEFDGFAAVGGGFVDLAAADEIHVGADFSFEVGDARREVGPGALFVHREGDVAGEFVYADGVDGGGVGGGHGGLFGGL